MFARVPSTSVQADHYMCVCLCLCGFVYVRQVCVLVLVKANTCQVFNDFNDWTFGTTGICVPRDLLLLTEGVKGTKTLFAFHLDGRWMANWLSF